ncbi:hypothetical protein [Desulfobacter sp.]|uniref:hypothetical protein n=1 Tax=Desulfobacter sp. TaxID=2294 RepID=UPI003D150745
MIFKDDSELQSNQTWCIPAQPGWFYLWPVTDENNKIVDLEPDPILAWLIQQEPNGVDAQPILASGEVKEPEYIQRPDGTIEELYCATYDNKDVLLKTLESE